MLRLTGIKLFILAVLLNGCSEIALLSSGTSLAISNNTYAKAYSGIDFATALLSTNAAAKLAVTLLILFTLSLANVFILAKLATANELTLPIPIMQ